MAKLIMVRYNVYVFVLFLADHLPAKYRQGLLMNVVCFLHISVLIPKAANNQISF